MPSNLVTINYSKELEWIVVDSQMNRVISLLNEVGDKWPDDSTSDDSPLPCSQRKKRGKKLKNQLLDIKPD